MPALRVDLETSAGVKVGSGPLIRATNVRVTRRLSKAGTVAFDFPASDRKAANIASKQIAKVWTRRAGAQVAVAAGIVDNIAAREYMRGEASGTAAMIGFLGAAAAARAAAYTQTFSTTARTVPAYTTNAQNAAYTGINNAQAGTPYAQLTDLNLLRVAYENLRASYDETVKVLNSVIDDLQTFGLVG